MNRELEEIFAELGTDKLQQLARLLKAQGKKPILTAEQLLALQQAGAKIEAVEPPKRMKRPVSAAEQQQRADAQQAAERLRIANRAQNG